MKIRHITLTTEFLKQILGKGTNHTKVIENGFSNDDFLLNLEIDPFDKIIHFYFITEDTNCPDAIEGMRFRDIPMTNPILKTIETKDD